MRAPAPRTLPLSEFVRFTVVIGSGRGAWYTGGPPREAAETCVRFLNRDERDLNNPYEENGFEFRVESAARAPGAAHIRRTPLSGAASSGLDCEAGVDITVPNAARIYDYAIGGVHNFAVDRAFWDETLKAFPTAGLVGRVTGFDHKPAVLRRALGSAQARFGGSAASGSNRSAGSSSSKGHRRSARGQDGNRRRRGPTPSGGLAR